MTLRTLIAAATAVTLVSLALAQGALAPASGPAPTMKTLDQIEPRTPIGAVGGSTSTITISKPGSYVLMGNVVIPTNSDGIIITAADVTLDLNGFSLSTTYGSNNYSGIAIGTDANNVTIRNGRIMRIDPKLVGGSTTVCFRTGIDIRGASVGAEVADIVVNGALYDGIYLGNNSRVRHCTVTDCRSGISAGQVSDSVAENCTERAINGTIVENCRGISTNGEGIAANETVSGSTGISTETWGIACAFGNVTNCTAASEKEAAILAGQASLCTGATNAKNQPGIFVLGTASFCQGSNSNPTSAAITAAVAIGCTSAGGLINAPKQYPAP
jgi:hypothetical protein